MLASFPLRWQNDGHNMPGACVSIPLRSARNTSAEKFFRLSLSFSLCWPVLFACFSLDSTSPLAHCNRSVRSNSADLYNVTCEESSVA